MKSLFSKKLVIVSSILILVVGVSLIVAFTVGNIATPSLSEPDGVFYERTDENGDVIYEITNQELYDHIRSNNGLNQLRFMLDNHILQAYIDEAANDQDAIDDKKLELMYGTSDPDEIADLDPETREDLETSFEQQMYLAGYGEDEDLYAIIALARENYARDAIAIDGLTDAQIADYYTNRYFEDIRALRIRFTSEADARDVLAKFNFAYYEDEEGNPRLGRYLGYVFTDEALLDDEENIVEAYETVVPYYFDDNGNLRDLDEDVIYTAGEDEDTFTDDEDNTYTLDDSGNLIDDDEVIIVESTRLFDTLEAAETYKEDNTTYYDVHKADPFDEDESVKILLDGTIEYTILPDGTIHDSDSDVVDAADFDIIINKTYTPHAEVDEFTPTVVDELSDEEVLSEYINMYNYVYGEYRDRLPVWHVGDDLYYDLESVPATETAERVDVDFLNTMDNDWLDYSFEEVDTLSSGLADYMFTELNGEDYPYTGEPQDFSGGNDDYHYMVFRLSPEEEKTDVFGPMFDLIEQEIVLPETIGEDVELPTEGLYDASISWTVGDDDKDIIDNKGVVTNPDEDTEVSLTYKITLGSETRTGAKTVTVLSEGDNADVTIPDVSETPIKELIGDDADYAAVVDALVDQELSGDNVTQTINSKLAALYTELGVDVFDYHLALDYASFNGDFEFNGKGDKDLLAQVNGYVDLDTEIVEETFEVTPDDFLSYTMDKNAALYVIGASRPKEVIHSVYYQDVFGEQTDISRNNSDMMDEIEQNVDAAVQQYSYYKQVYNQYGIDYPYDNFIDYAYAQYGTYDNEGLLEYFVASKLQPYFVNETLDNEQLIEAMYPTVQEYFNNYFSLDVNQVVIYLDRDEDGAPDDYNAFYDGLDADGQYDLEGMLAALETAVNDYLEDNDDDFDGLTETYAEASREDETWGAFKQYGFMILNEELSMQDQDDQEVTHSLHYSGEYGVKDRYVQGFVDALVDLYQEYRLPQNDDLESLYSPLVDTEYGLHIIRAQKGENFDKPAANFTDGDDEYADGLDNDQNMPTLEQLRVYADYFMYTTAYDLSEADAEERYGIDVPEIPATLADAFDFYFGDILKEAYVLGTLNINIAARLDDGHVLSSTYTDHTDADVKAQFAELRNVYYDALFGPYVEDDE